MNVSGQSISQQLIALLTLCQPVRSEKDGILRPLSDKATPGVSDTFDDFARQSRPPCLYAPVTCCLLFPQSRMADAGGQPERQGQMNAEAGDNGALAAVPWPERRAGMVNPQ